MGTNLTNLNVKIFSDGADKSTMLHLAKDPLIKGLTTNPTLMKKAGISDYKKFAQEILKEIQVLPISFEVFSDDFREMERQAMEINSWGKNVYVKIPITNSEGASSAELIQKLSERGVKLNVTAILTTQQVVETCMHLNKNVPAIISVFAGRIADTGVNPVPIMSASLEILQSFSPLFELLWASPREAYNIVEANQVGCHIITCTKDIIEKFKNLRGKKLQELSLDTVRMFSNDAKEAGFSL